MLLHTTVLVFLCFLLQWAVSQRSWKQLVSAGVWFDYFGWSCVEPGVGVHDPRGSLTTWDSLLLTIQISEKMDKSYKCISI